MKTRRSAPWTFLLATASCVPNAHSQPQPSSQPKSLEECYLQAALPKTNADMAYLAREICDAVFKPQRRSIFVLDTSTGACVEWWLDHRGRYETASMYCALEPAGGEKLTLGCQFKERPFNYFLVELSRQGDAYQRVGDSLGTSPGPMFVTMAACLRQKTRR